MSGSATSALGVMFGSMWAPGARPCPRGLLGAASRVVLVIGLFAVGLPAAILAGCGGSGSHHATSGSLSQVGCGQHCQTARSRTIRRARRRFASRRRSSSHRHPHRRNRRSERATQPSASPGVPVSAPGPSVSQPAVTPASASSTPAPSQPASSGCGAACANAAPPGGMTSTPVPWLTQRVYRPKSGVVLRPRR